MVNKRIGGVAGKAKNSIVRMGAAKNQRRVESLRTLENKLEQAKQFNETERIKELEAKIRKIKRGGQIRNPRQISDYRAAQQRANDDLIEVIPTVGKPTGLRSGPPMPDMDVSIYLDTDDAVTALKIVKATQRIANELGYQTPRIVEVERGSFIARFLAAWNGAKGQKVRADSMAKAKEIALEAEQYGRLYVQDKQADVDQKNVSSAVELINASADVPSVAVKAGALLFLKYTGPDGQPVIVSRTLSTREMAIYDKTPSLKADPSKVEENLAILVALDEAREDDRPRAIGQ